MGCDIHMYVEKKHKGKWINIDYWKLDDYYENKPGDYKFEIVEMYGDRNYRLFAVLADVRNYSNNKPISEPKGFPDDASWIVKEEYERWIGDGHSHSYLTLSELKKHAKENNVTKYSGMVSPKAAAEIDRGIFPELWCMETTDKDWVYREWEEKECVLDPLIKVLEERAKEWVWGDINNDDIRIVFWFDN